MYKHKRFVFYHSCIWAKLLNIILFAYDKRQNIYHASKHEKMFWIHNFSSLNLSICKHWLQNLINYLQTTKKSNAFSQKDFYVWFRFFFKLRENMVQLYWYTSYNPHSRTDQTCYNRWVQAEGHCSSCTSCLWAR